MLVTDEIRQATKKWIASTGGIMSASRLIEANPQALYNLINGKTTNANRISEKLLPLIKPFLPADFELDCPDDDILKLRRTIIDKVKTLDKDKLLKAIELLYNL